MRPGRTGAGRTDQTNRIAKMKRPFIPEDLFKQGFSPIEFTVYCYISMRDGGSGCWESVSKLATNIGVHRATAYRALTCLIDSGWIRKEGRKLFLTEQGQTMTRSSVNDKVSVAEIDNSTEKNPDSTQQNMVSPVDLCDKLSFSATKVSHSATITNEELKKVTTTTDIDPEMENRIRVSKNYAGLTAGFLIGQALRGGSYGNE